MKELKDRWKMELDIHSMIHELHQHLSGVQTEVNDPRGT